MMGSNLFRRNFAMMATVVLLFVVLGATSTALLFRLASNPKDFRAPPPPTFFAKLVDELNPRERVQGLKRMGQLIESQSPMSFELLNQDGEVLFPENHPKLEGWPDIRKPEGPYEALALPGIKKGGFAPPPLPMRPGDFLIRFPGSPIQYLHVSFTGLPGGPPPIWFPIVMFGSLALSVVLGIGFALFLLFRSMREKMRLADSVIDELKNGNLKARFPIHRMDEMGQAMSRFNKMAEEIERLVEQLRSVEKSRMLLLQELAHDLRTPVASMKNLLATMEKKSEAMTIEIRKELLSLSLKEVDYFERLVEDLLVLAQVSEPQYHADRTPLATKELLEEEAASVATHYENQGKVVTLECRMDPGSFEIYGDSHLIRRLFRNALENAFSFCKSRVMVTLKANGLSEISVCIRDDGPGIASELLSSFGERRISRSLGTQANSRLSVGLGSVIMKAVTQIHRGSLSVKNLTSTTGNILGAEVRILLPRKSEETETRV